MSSGGRSGGQLFARDGESAGGRSVESGDYRDFNFPITTNRGFASYFVLKPGCSDTATNGAYYVAESARYFSGFHFLEALDDCRFNKALTLSFNRDIPRSFGTTASTPISRASNPRIRLS